MMIFGPDGTGMRDDPRFAVIRKTMNLPSASTVH